MLRLLNLRSWHHSKRDKALKIPQKDVSDINREFMMASVMRENDYDHVVIRPNAENIASLIIANQSSKEIVLTTEDDEVFLLASEDSIDLCLDDLFLRKELLPMLNLIRIGAAELRDVTIMPEEYIKRFASFKKIAFKDTIYVFREAV